MTDTLGSATQVTSYSTFAEQILMLTFHIILHDSVNTFAYRIPSCIYFTSYRLYTVFHCIRVFIFYLKYVCYRMECSQVASCSTFTEIILTVEMPTVHYYTTIQSAHFRKAYRHAYNHHIVPFMNRPPLYQCLLHLPRLQP